MIVPRYYENTEILFENTMPYRAYYIPASADKGPLVEDREKSDRIQLLNGQWQFQYFDSIYDLQDEFYREDYLADDYDNVKVPGIWQSYGYDYYQYTNVRYPIPLDPPYVPQENPCGAYRYRFEYHKDENAPKAFLNFEGVDSCFYVWLNGQYVGYRQVSHANSEFDVTDVIREGENTIAVLVLKWCDGTYLEDQDKFRMSGIFRDVYILNRPINVIYDYFVQTDIKKSKAVVRIEALALGNIEGATATLFNQEGIRIAQHKFKKNNREDYPYYVEFNIENPVLWNPEQPYLYSLLLGTDKEVIHDRIGIRTIEIKDKVIYLNGSKIKFRGVNRHDSNPVTGFVVDIEQLKTDLIMMKQYNFNAIRSSHYPNAPYFYQLCDEYGFYVIDEADNESHGTQTQYLADRSWDNVVEQWNKRIADNPDFILATMDRTKLCVHRDKNRPSVVIWSMGNEGAYGCTFEEALKWTKNFDNTRLTHYESACYRSKERKYDFSNIDIYSRMYPSLEEIQEYLDSNPDKPFLLVEYCHAMGNGPGDFEDYFQWIAKNDLMCGGFVWEWCDHAMDKGIADNGKTIYFYGGDHGEKLHDGNFCLDGLVYPDRTPHTGLVEFKNVHRPARVLSFSQETGKITIYNHMDFLNLEEYVEIQYELIRDGYVTEKGNVLLENSVKPRTMTTSHIEVSVPEAGKCFLRILYLNKKESAFVAKGQELGWEEIRLKNKKNINQTVAMYLEKKKSECEFEVEEDDRYLIIRRTGFLYFYNKLTGLFDKMEVGKQKILTHPMEINIWRAPTDNDRKIKNMWMAAGYDDTVARAYETSYKVMPDRIEIHTRGSLVAVSIQKIMDMEIIWTVYQEGELEVSIKGKKDEEFPELPRFGLRLFLNKDYDLVKYCGIGPFESYVDKHYAGRHGVYEAKVLELHEDYIKPQENGSHYDCDYVKVEGKTRGMTFVSQHAFSFHASVYSQEELTEKKHNYELVPSDSTILCLDYKQNGIGSNSCGPEVLPEYRLDENEFACSWKMIYDEKTVFEK